MKILRSSLLNFVELVGQMAIAPGTAEEKAADIRDLFNNMHYLINQYRPHQARETLIQKMEQQVLDRKAEIDEVDRLDGKLSELLASLQDRQLQDLHNGDPAEDIVMTNGHGHHSHSKTHNEQVWESVMDAFNR